MGFGLGVDPLTGFFLLTLAATAVPALVYAIGYLPGVRNATVVGLLTAAFILALAGVLTARTVLTLLTFWELMTLLPAGAILVTRHEPAARRSVYQYLAITHLGGTGVWVSLLLLASKGGLTDPAALRAAGAGLQALIALAAIVGFGTKAGIIPFHSWLPKAHPLAPSHISALMSGVMLKVALYGLIRVLFEWLPIPPGLGGGTGTRPGSTLRRWSVSSTPSSSTNSNACWPSTPSRTWASSCSAWGRRCCSATAATPRGPNSRSPPPSCTPSTTPSSRACCSWAPGRSIGRSTASTSTGWADCCAGCPGPRGAFLIGAMAIAGLPPLNGFASEWLTLQSLLHVTTGAGVPATGTVALGGTAMGTALAGALATAGLADDRRPGRLLLREGGRPRAAGAGPTSRGGGGTRSSAADGGRRRRVLAVLCVVLGVMPGLLVPRLAGPAACAGGNRVEPVAAAAAAPGAVAASASRLRGPGGCPRPALPCS